ncbi:MAG: cytochrome P450 [bacterium]
MPDGTAPALFIPPKPDIPPINRPGWKKLCAILDNPVKLWDAYFFENPYFQIKTPKRRFVQIMDPDLVRQILMDKRVHFSKSHMQDRLLKPALGEGLLTTNGEKWRRQRKAAAPAFRHEKLLRLLPVMNNSAQNCVSRMNTARKTNNIIDLHTEMTRATYDIIAATLLSDETQEAQNMQSKIAQDVTLFLNTVGKVNILDLFDAPNYIPRSLVNPGIIQGRHAVKRLRKFCAKIIAHRQSLPHPGEDLLGLMLSAHDPQTGYQQTDQELLDNVLTFIAAGHETTAQALSWTLMIISRHHATLSALKEEADQVLGHGPVTVETLSRLSLHERVIKEAMRLYPPAPVIPRSVISPVQLGDLSLESGDHVTIANYPMLRHRQYWDNPDAFDPTRFLPAAEKARHRYLYIPFGAGPHICIGMKFAMMEAITILAHLTRAFQFSPVAHHFPEPVMTITMRPKGGMPLRVQQLDPIDL